MRPLKPSRQWRGVNSLELLAKAGGGQRVADVTATAYFWGEDSLEGLRKLAALARSRGFKTLRTSLSRKLVSGRLEFGITPLDEVIILAKSL